MGFFDKIKQSLARTKEQFAGRFDEAVRRADAPDARSRPVDVDTVEALEEALISADVGVAATERIVNVVRRRSAAGAGLRDLVKQEIRAIFAAVDRPIVVEQLQVWATRAGVDFIRAQGGADPAAVVFDALTAGRARGRDVVLVDTAGRLHTRANLMQELEKIRRVASREIAGAPHETLLVLDATVGQNGLVQAREFMSVAGVTGIVLTKLDGTAKGGMAVAIAHDLWLPIRYVGVGEAIDALLPFPAEEYADALFVVKW